MTEPATAPPGKDHVPQDGVRPNGLPAECRRHDFRRSARIGQSLIPFEESSWVKSHERSMNHTDAARIGDLPSGGTGSSGGKVRLRPAHVIPAPAILRSVVSGRQSMSGRRALG